MEGVGLKEEDGDPRGWEKPEKLEQEEIEVYSY